MMKKLIKALKLCAKAHRQVGKVSRIDSLFYVLTCNVPLAADIQSIVTGFTGSHDAVKVDYKHCWISVSLDKCMILPKEDIDWMIIRMALPYGTVI